MPKDGKLYQFKNSNILRDHKIIREDLWVRDGKIIDPEKTFYDEKISAEVTIDCKNNLIAPGFIDVQINGGFGYDFSFETNTQKALNVVSRKLLEHGVTAYCPTVVTSPTSIYQAVLPKMKPREGDINGATILGVHVEGPFINKDKKGAHPAECIVENNQGISQIESVYGSLENVKIITLAPELVTSDVIQKLKRQNICVSLGHSAANLAQGEEAILNGANLITHLFNAMLPFHHRDPGLVGLLSSDNISEKNQVYFGIIADGIHTHDAALRIAYRVQPDGLILVTDAISALGLPRGQYKIGQMDVEVTDKRAAYILGTNTLCGSIASMIECVNNLMHATGCTPEYALEAASYHPAKCLGIENQKGTLNYGADADFILLSSEFDIVSTWINGECVFERDD